MSSLLGDDDPGGSLDHNMKHLMSKVGGVGWAWFLRIVVAFLKKTCCEKVVRAHVVVFFRLGILLLILD